MNIAILSREPNNYSTRRLVEVARARGHQVEVLDTLRCYMNIASHSPSIHYEGRELESYDAVIPRIGASITFYGTAVLRQFEMMSTMALNSSVAISRSRDKLRAMQLLSRHGIGLPVTGYAHSTHDVPDLITMVGRPLVVKLLEGTQGIGVVLCETQKAAESVIEAFIQTNNNILVQEYIREANGADIRCLVVNGRWWPPCAARPSRGVSLQPAPGRHRRSHQDHAGRACHRRAGRQDHGAGRGRGGHPAKRPRPAGAGGELLPGLQGVEAASGKDVAGKIIEFLELKASRKHKPAE